MLTERDLERKSVQYRKTLLRLIKACGSGHTGGDLSRLDIINVLYNHILRVSPESFTSPDRDYYIQRKGDIAELVRTLDAIPFRPGKPSLVLAKTRKGKGISPPIYTPLVS
jgi:transketolase